MGVLLMVLVACGNTDDNNDVDDQSATNDDQVTETETETEDDAEATEEDDIDEQADDESEAEDESDADGNAEHSDLEEYTTVSNEIDLDKYDMDIEEDNSNKRIILYEDEKGNKEYKSIYLKEKNRLKIIEFDKEDGEIFNEVID